MTLTTDRVDISYSGYRLVDDNIPAIPSPQQLKDCNGLVCPLDAGAIVLTGTDTGFITVGVSVLDSEPEFALDDWEEAVDVSVHATEGAAGRGWVQPDSIAAGTQYRRTRLVQDPLYGTRPVVRIQYHFHGIDRGTPAPGTARTTCS